MDGKKSQGIILPFHLPGTPPDASRALRLFGGLLCRRYSIFRRAPSSMGAPSTCPVSPENQHYA